MATTLTTPPLIEEETSSATISESSPEVAADPIIINNNANNNELAKKGTYLLPLKQHLQDTLQLAGVIHHVFVWVLLPIMSLWVPFYILFATPIWWTMILYAGWFVYDFNTPAKGSRKSDFFRRARVWKYMADYFPVKLVKTAELSPDSNYIMGCHPHGVFSVGAFTALCTEANGFSDLFPGMDSTILTLNGQFYFPFRREIGTFLGGCESSRRSLTYLLKNPGKGRVIGIVVGGAEEALDAAPGTHNLHIKSRRGFCKFALTHGAHLLPSYSFGENDYYDQTYPNPRGSRLRKVQTWIKKRFGFCPPFFCGRGVFSATSGLLPYRRPVTTVVGSPITVEKCAEPTQSQIEELHSQYLQALNDLFEEHKAAYGVDKDTHLTFW